MNRIVQSELLDTLPPDDPRAVRSRRDLRRVNAWMRNHVIMARALQGTLDRRTPAVLTDLGAGDGTFVLRVAQRLAASRATTLGGAGDPANTVAATLLDMHGQVGAATLGALASLGWRARCVVADVLDWPRSPATGEVVIANLFLHHFKDRELVALLRMISQRASCFIAIEPRRAPLPLLCARLLGAIGCNDVTRHDAVVSVRGGFSGTELSALWPDKPNWQLAEHRAGAFSHLFIARKLS